MHDDEVWCECEYSDGVDYQQEVEKSGTGYRAMMSEIPVNGFYRFKTSPQMIGRWIIAGSIKIHRILTDEEAAEIVRLHGYEPLPRSPRYQMRKTDGPP